jgi:hypothetical protein
MSTTRPFSPDGPVGSAATLAIVLVLASCRSDDVVSQGDTSGGEATSTTASDDTSTGSSEDTGLATTTGSEDGFVPARSIVVSQIEVNQGVGIPIASGGRPLGPDERIAPIITRRPALVRAFWALDDDWDPREIEARLHLHHADGTLEVLSHTKLVQGSSPPTSLEHSFYWGIEAPWMEPGLRYHVELWEVGIDDDVGSEHPSSARFPDEGTTLLGVERDRMLMHVVIVPFVYDAEGCVTEPDLTEATLQDFHDHLYALNPVEHVELTVRDPIVWSTKLESFGELNLLLSDLRFADGAPPEVYYYGVVDPCTSMLSGFGGMAHGIPIDPTSPDAAFQRVASGLSGSARLFVHEVGHSQGRHHVACQGDEAWPDATYPHPTGSINEWGFGLIDFGLKHPTMHKDYMSYCAVQWVGAWGWNKVVPVIRTLSGWGSDEMDQEDGSGLVLVGLLLPSGREIWHTVPGRISAAPQDSSTRIELRADGRLVASRPAHVTELPDGRGETMIVAELPVDLDAETRMVRVSDGGRTSIEPAMPR